MPSNNPFFAGQSHKKRSVPSNSILSFTNIHEDEHHTDRKDKPSPLRIIKTGRSKGVDEAQNSITCGNAITNTKCSSQGMFLPKLAIAKRRSQWKLNEPTVSFGDAGVQEFCITQQANPSIIDRQAKPHYSFLSPVKNDAASTTNRNCSVNQDSYFTNANANGHSRRCSDESGSSAHSSLWDSYNSRSDSTRISSFEIIDDSKSTNYPISRNACQPPPQSIGLQSVLPHVLVPHISVTTDMGYSYDGRESIWAAVEISGKLSYTYSAETIRGYESLPQPQHRNTFDDHQLDLFFKHGCLYDLSVEILSSAGTSVIQVLQENSFPTAIYAGSNILLLVQMRFNDVSSRYGPTADKHRQHSEQLMEDLASQLGDSKVAYMEVRTSYCHSAFPAHSGPEILDGVSSLHNRMETIAVASLNRHNASSRWSPCPIATNSVQDIIKRHWGDEKANALLKKMLHQPIASRKLVKAQSKPLLRSNWQDMLGPRQQRRASTQSEAVARPSAVRVPMQENDKGDDSRVSSAIRSISKSMEARSHSNDANTASNENENGRNEISHRGSDKRFWEWGLWF